VRVTYTDESGESHTVEAEWLIGADGGKSFVRDALGIDLVGTTQVQRWIVIDLLGETRKYEKYADFHCNGERPYVLVPGIKGRLRIEYMLFDNEDPDEMTKPEKIAELVKHLRNPLDPADVRRANVYVAHQRVARHYRKGRAFLVGDAAHLMPPFAGQGINAGVRDAHNLAWKLIEAERGGATKRLLDSYELERRTHGAKMVEVSRRIGAVVMARGGFRTRLRDAVVRTVSIVPKVYDFIANMRFITPPDYSNGVAVPALRSGIAVFDELIGRALPQPVVRTAAGDEHGLDLEIGPDWALIEIGATGFVKDEYWLKLRARRIRLLPHGSQPSAEADMTEVQDTAGVLSRATSGAAVLVVRPDKYVAAVFGPGQEATAVTGLRAFVDDRARAGD